MEKNKEVVVMKQVELEERVRELEKRDVEKARMARVVLGELMSKVRLLEKLVM